MTYYICKNDELYHYGVKGMKWGVRHDRPRVGNKNRRFKATDKKKWSTKKKIAVGAAAIGGTLAVLGGVYLYKEFNTSLIGFSYDTGEALKDVLSDYNGSNGVSLKKGTTFQRISSEAIEDYTKRGQEYVSYMFRDNARYKKRLPSESWFAGKTAYVHKIKTTVDVKAPSSKEAASIFLKVKPDAMQYEWKNFMANGISDTTNKTRNEFVFEVKKRGYNALIDENDSSWTNSPLILLDPSKTIENSKSRKLKAAERVISTYFI